MSTQGLTGLLPTAMKSSMVGLIVGMALGIGLFIAQLSYSIGDPDGGALIPSPFLSMLAMGITSFTLACLVVNMSARKIRDNRRIIANQELMIANQERGLAALGRLSHDDECDGLTPEMVETARRLSLRLNHTVG